MTVPTLGSPCHLLHSPMSLALEVSKLVWMDLLLQELKETWLLSPVYCPHQLEATSFGPSGPS